MNRSKIREILKKLKYNSYYEHVPHIINRLNGVPPPIMSPEKEEELRRMFKEIQIQFPKIVGFQHSKNHIKVAAGWLIEQAGWKGFKVGDIGVYEKQALVLVNYGKGNGEQILKLSKKIQESVFSKFNIKIVPEVNII